MYSRYTCLQIIKKSKTSFYFIMHALTVVLIVSSTVCGLQTSGIIGGYNDEESKYPYQASIRKQNFPICGGSIVHNNYILTAAHCIYRKLPAEITVVVGTYYLYKYGYTYETEQLIWHEQYNETNFLHDIGLIRTKNRIEYNEKVQPILLASEFYVAPGEQAIVTGWGRLHADSPHVPDTLQVINVTVIAQEICEITYWQATKNNICTFTRKDEGVCNGDSGGPLVIHGKQVGIFSYGRPCAIGHPDVYTRVYPYEEWIFQNFRLSNSANRVNSNKFAILLLAISSIIFYWI